MKTITEIKYGVSACAFDPAFNNLSMRGWCVPVSAYDTISITIKGKAEVGQAILELPRADVLEKYPEHNEPNSGWKFEASGVDLQQGDIVQVSFMLKRKVVKLHETSAKVDYSNIAAFQKLQEAFTVNVEKGASVDIQQIHTEFEQAGFDIIDQAIDFGAWKQWRSEVNYERNYPKYINQFKNNMNEKSLQHYLSMLLLGKGADDTIMDVASSFSVFPEILKDYYGLSKVWRQDMEYAEGVHGNKIGSFGSSIPLDDGVIDGITLHCSLEHFEGDEDIRLFHEAFRLLRPGGKICIIPLYMANILTVITSPSVWANKFTSYSEMPEFDKRAVVHIQESKKQRQIKLYDVKTLKEDLLIPFADKATIKIYHFPNNGEVKSCPVYALILEKL